MRKIEITPTTILMLMLPLLYPAHEVHAGEVDQPATVPLVAELQASDPTLPSGVAHPKGLIGRILANMFRSDDATIATAFLHPFKPLLGGAYSSRIPVWDGAVWAASLKPGTIRDDISIGLVGIGLAPVAGNGALQVSGNVSASNYCALNGTSCKSPAAIVGAYWSSAGYIPRLTAPTDLTNSVLFQDASGNIGIGMTNPNARFHVAQSGPATALLGESTWAWYGVYGQSDASYGVSGKSTSPSFGGIIGFSSDETVYGILGIQGYSFYGNGDAYVGGNVGIGTISPSASLHVVGTELRLSDDAALFRFTNSANSATTGYLRTLAWTAMQVVANDTNIPLAFYTSGLNERMRITPSGKIGIGATSPSELLTVGTGTSRNVIASVGGYGDPAAPGASSNGDRITFIDNASWTTAMGFGTLNDMWFQSTAATGDPAFRFYTGQNAGGTPIERVRITSTGYVWIGTSSPQKLLEVVANNAFNGIRLRSQNTSGRPALDFVHANGVNGTWAVINGNVLGIIDFGGHDGTALQSAAARIRSLATANWGPSTRDSALVFQTTSGLSNGERMRITSTGAIGIGTASPAALLDINGNAIVQGSLKVSCIWNCF